MAAGGSPPRVRLELPGQAPYATTAGDAVRRHVGEWRLSPDWTIGVRGVSHSRRARLIHVHTRTYLRGIPVFGGGGITHVDEDGAIVRGPGPPALRQPGMAAPVLDAATAIQRAGRTILRDEVQASDAAQARLTWYPLGREPVLGWEALIHGVSGQLHHVVASAVDGSVLFSHDLYRHARPMTAALRAPDVASPDKGRRSLESLTGWPPHHNDCPRPLYPSAAGTSCWVDGTAAAGNNAVVCSDRTGRNFCEWQPSSVNGDFVFEFLNSYALDGDARPDEGAAAMNAFYWVNVVHDWLFHLGFDEPSGNFQAANFDRGGLGEDAVRIDIHDKGRRSNAAFATPPDGWRPRLEMGLFPDTARDSAFDADILIHEYVHGLTARLVGGPDNVDALPAWQSGALSEGWSDVYAASFTGDPVFGEYVAAEPASGLRSASLEANPYTFGQFGTLYPTRIKALDWRGEAPQLHRDGEIWAGALWDVRGALGRDLFEAAMTAGLKLTDARPSMLQARDAMLLAVERMEGEEATCRAWEAFAARGFGLSAHLNPREEGAPADTALSVYESFDAPIRCGGVPLVVGETLFAAGAELGEAEWRMSGLWRVTERRASDGRRSWWFGSPGSGGYATGERAHGSLTSPPIELPDAPAILEWAQRLTGEGFGRPYFVWQGLSAPYLNLDAGRVEISDDEGSTWHSLSHIAHNTSGAGFERFRINLTRYAGRAVQLRFTFDSLDEVRNEYEGWFVDEVRVSRLVGKARATLTPLEVVAVTSISSSGPLTKPLRLSDAPLGREWRATTGANWASVAPAVGRGAAELTIILDPSGLAPGTHRTTLWVAGEDGQAVAEAAVILRVQAPGRRRHCTRCAEAEPSCRSCRSRLRSWPAARREAAPENRSPSP